jgi:hypothetical protein
MTLSALGIFSAAGAGGVGGTYELIETAIVSGSSTSSVVFSNLGNYSSTYKHLQVRLVARAGRALQNEPLYMSFNGVGGTSYATHAIAGNGSGFFVEGYASLSSIERVGIIAGSTAETNNFGATVIDILDAFSTTKKKTTRALGGVAPASGAIVGLYSGLFNSTASTTSLTFTNFSGTAFLANSRFSLYGIRG